jgi:ABC-type multidrug transport system fused ATPase/permease subunit
MNQPETKQSALFPWLWRRFLRRYRGLMLLAMLFLAIEGGMSAMMSYMMKPLFDDGFMADNAGALGWIGLVFLGIFVLRGVTSVVQKIILARVSQLTMGDIRQDLLAHLMRLDMSFHLTHGPGHLIQRIEGDVEGIAKLWRTLITSAGKDLVSVVALLGLALWLDWAWTLTILLGAPLLMAPAMILQRYVRANARHVRDMAARMSSHVNESFLGILPVKLNQLETYQSRRYRLMTRDRVRTEVRSTAGSASMPGLIDVMSGLAFAGILYFGGREIVGGDKTVGDFMAFFTAIGMMFDPLRRLGAVSGAWQVAAASIERIRELLDITPTLRDPDHPLPPPTGVPAISLRDVHLSFGEAPALRGLDLEIEAGKTTALVGASGAGKSTVFNLLTRLVDPDRGDVLLGDVPVNAMTLADLRGSFSVVTQEALLFDDSLRENLILDRDVTPEALKRALQDAHMADFLPRLEKGLDSPVGPRGSALSGGQRQRVAIARALLRDAPILLLDEATSALDAQSETVVQRALDQLAEGRTTLVIAHRLSTIRNADKIVVMEAGRVVEEGTHEELLQMAGSYAELYAMQFDEA